MIELVIILGACAAVLLIGVAFASKPKGKVRKAEWSDGYLRLYPNPGFKFGTKHWCRKHGWRRH